MDSVKEDVLGGVEGEAEEVDGLGRGAVGGGIVAGMDLREGFLGGAAIGLELEDVDGLVGRGHDIGAAGGLGNLRHDIEPTGGEEDNEEALIVGLMDALLV